MALLNVQSCVSEKELPQEAKLPLCGSKVKGGVGDIDRGRDRDRDGDSDKDRVRVENEEEDEAKVRSKTPSENRRGYGSLCPSSHRLLSSCGAGHRLPSHSICVMLMFLLCIITLLLFSLHAGSDTRGQKDLP